MRFVVDVCLSPDWVAHLVGHGWEALHWSAIGPLGAPDRDVLAHCRSSDSVLFTHDLDFGAILAVTGATKPSVLQLREQDTDPEVVGKAVIAAIEQCKAALEQDALVTVDLRRAKARILPLR